MRSWLGLTEFLEGFRGSFWARPYGTRQAGLIRPMGEAVASRKSLRKTAQGTEP